MKTNGLFSDCNVLSSAWATPGREDEWTGKAEVRKELLQWSLVAMEHWLCERAEYWWWLIVAWWCCLTWYGLQGVAVGPKTVYSLVRPGNVKLIQRQRKTFLLGGLHPHLHTIARTHAHTDTQTHTHTFGLNILIESLLLLLLCTAPDCLKVPLKQFILGLSRPLTTRPPGVGEQGQYGLL